MTKHYPARSSISLRRPLRRILIRYNKFVPNGFTRNDHDTVALPTFHANRENKPVYAVLQVKFLIINRSGIRACHNHHNAFGDEIVLIKLPVKKKSNCVECLLVH